MRSFAALLCLVLALAGCAPASPTATTSTAAPADLVAQRTAGGIAACPSPSGAAAVQGGLPDLTLACLDGSSTLALGALRGPLVVNLWAQWCAPCRAESPHLREFWKRAQGKVAMLGIDYDDPDPALALEFATLVGWTYPHLADPSRLLAAGLGIPGIPVTLLIDADGRIVQRFTGPLTSTQELADAVASSLGVVV